MPVNPETIDKWVHPPYSGHFDGERIWGRGTADDKNGLIAILSVSSPISVYAFSNVLNRTAVEYLISAGFEPTRSLVLAFGFDEESSGTQVCIIIPASLRLRSKLEVPQGAGALSEYLLATFGRNGFALIVDEGGILALPTCSRQFSDIYPKSDGFLETYGSVTALPSVTEKGYIDVRLTVSSPGGHSSIPPKHTVEFFTQNSLAAILTSTRRDISSRPLVSWQRWLRN